MNTTLTTVPEAADGGLFVPIPSELLGRLGIREGDKVVLAEQADGTLLLTRVMPARERVMRLARTSVQRLFRLFH
jgi:antitoxin component of MazEF toxin-antitoxin module